jgi:hypothetical protein
MLDEHRKAERNAGRAAELLAAGEVETALALYAEAAEAERRALAGLRPDQVRTRSALSVSLASLLYKARRFAEAERAVFGLLATGELTPWAERKLRELLEVVADERVVAAGAGRKYAGSAITLSLRGGEIGSGTGPLDLVLEKANGFRNLLYRVAEMAGNYPLRLRGNPPREIADLLQARVGEPAAGSYRLVVRLTSPVQTELLDAPGVDPGRVADSLFDFLSLLSRGDAQGLERVAPDPGYRTALLQLTRNLAPAGNRIGEVGIYRGEGTGVDAVYLTRATLRVIRDVLPRRTEEDAPRTTVRGVLRALHLDQNWLELSVPERGTTKCQTLPETLDDVVGPMVNHEVIVRGHEKRLRGGVRRIVVEDIELAQAA